MAIDFWNQEIHPITGYKSNFGIVSLKTKRSDNKHIPWVRHKDFIEEDYEQTTIIATNFNIGTVTLSKKMAELGYKKTCYKGKMYFLLSEVAVLKNSGLLDVSEKELLDPSTMISTTELAEKYDIKPWERFKIVEASGLKPLMRKSGRVYFDKSLESYFIEYKNGTLKLKQRKK